MNNFPFVIFKTFLDKKHFLNANSNINSTFGVQYLAQGYFDMRTREAEDLTLPLESQPSFKNYPW